MVERGLVEVCFIVGEKCVFKDSIVFDDFFDLIFD